MKKKRLLIGIITILVLGTGVGGAIQRIEAAGEDNAQKALETSMGKMYLAEWTRVTSASQLKACTEATPIRLYATVGSSTYLVYDSTDSNTGSTMEVSPLKEADPAIAKNEGFAELTAEKPTNSGYIQYAGKTDSDNDDSPMCYVSLSSTGKTYLGVDSDRNLKIQSSDKTAWTVYLSDKDSKNYASFFVNIAYRDDPALYFNGTLYSNTKGYNSDYTKFALYIGNITDFTVIQDDITVGAGQTIRISNDGGVALQDGCTLTIEDGGAALIGTYFLNQGTINNHGTIVVMDKGSLQPVYQTGGTLNCDGGDLLVMSKGRFMSGESMTFSNGASVLNQGIFLASENVTLDNASLISESGSYTLLGYDILADDFRHAGTTTINDSCIAGTSTLPALEKSTLGKISDSTLRFSGKSCLINRGGTVVVHQNVSGSEDIRTEKGKTYR